MLTRGGTGKRGKAGSCVGGVEEDVRIGFKEGLLEGLPVVGKGGCFVGDERGRSDRPMPEKRKCSGEPSLGQSGKRPVVVEEDREEEH